MRSFIFDLKSYSKTSRFWDYLGFVFAILTLILFIITERINKNPIYLILISLFVGFFLLNMMISKKESLIKTLTFLIGGILILLYQYFNYDWNEPIIRYLSPLILILFSVLYVYHSNSLFNRLWNKNLLNFRDDWINIRVNTLDIVLIIIPLATIITSFLHFFNAYNFFLSAKTFSIDGFHQLLIGILLVLLFLDYQIKINKTDKKNFDKYIKETARVIFHTGIIYFFFDTLLEIYRIVNQSYISPENIFTEIINLIFLVYAFKLVFIQENTSILGIYSSTKAKDKFKEI